MDEQTVEVKAETAASRYEVLATNRRPFLSRAWDAAELTIPGLLPREGSSGMTELAKPYQSTGAAVVNNLGAKLLLALFPPGSSCFRLDADEAILKEAEAQEKGAADEINTALRDIEKRVMKHMEQSGARTQNFEAIVHLIVAGNALIQVLDGGKEKFYPMDRYVVKRDLSENVLEVIVKESLSHSALPSAVKEFLLTIPSWTEKDADHQKNIDLYTWVTRRDGGKWDVEQQVEGRQIPDTQGSYPADKCAWLPLRWRGIPGEDYGRGHCEEYGGALRSLESLEQSIIEFAAAAAKGLVLVDESGVTSKEKVAKSSNWAVIDGRAADVTTLQLENFPDFQIAKAVRDDIKKDIEAAFLKAGSIQRDAERVTAEEIRAMITELESSLGGIYSILATEFQRPLIVRIIHQLQMAGKLPHLPDGAVSPQIVTGVEGLGRTSDAQKLQSALNGLGQLFGPDALAQNINVNVYLSRVFTALGVEDNGLVKSQDQIQQETAARTQQSMTEKLGGSMIGAVTKGAELAHASNQAATPQPT